MGRVGKPSRADLQCQGKCLARSIIKALCFFHSRGAQCPVDQAGTDEKTDRDLRATQHLSIGLPWSDRGSNSATPMKAGAVPS
jgi:hypothetical protein